MARLGSAIPGYGDASWFLWDLWWFKHALTHAIDPLTTNLVFFPLRDVPMMWQTPLNELLGVPLQLVFGLTLAYNILLLTASVLSAYMTYRLGYYLTQDRRAAFVAGLVFAFCPYRQAHDLGHLSLVTTQWLPFLAWRILRFGQDPTGRNAVWFGVGLALVGLSTPYYLLYGAAPMLVLCTIYAFRVNRAGVMARSSYINAAVGLGLAFMVLLPFYLPYVSTSPDVREALSRASSEAQNWSADLLGYFLPPAWNPLLGKWTWPWYRHFINPTLAEKTVFPGFIAWALATIGVITSWRRRRPLVLLWVALGAAAIMFSMGPYLEINGRRMCTMPYALIRSWPIVNALRVPARLAVTLQLAVAALTALGVAALLARVKRELRTPVVVVLTLAFLLEAQFMFPFPSSPTYVPKFYQELAKRPESLGVLELPLNSGMTWYQYYQTVHRKPLVHGYLGRMPARLYEFEQRSPVVSALIELSPDHPTIPPISDIQVKGLAPGESRSLLRGDGIGWVILHRTLPEPPAVANTPVVLKPDQFLRARAQLDDLLGRPAYAEDSLLVYDLTATPIDRGTSVPTLGAGWYGLERGKGAAAGQIWRWMADLATLHLRYPAPKRLRISIRAHSIGQPRVMDVFVDGTLIDRLTVATETKEYRTKAYDFPGGSSEIRLVSASGTETPAGDPRALSFAVSKIALVPDDGAASAASPEPIVGSSEGRIAFDATMTGLGWGNPEVGPAGESFRWMTSSASELDLPLWSGCDESLEAEIYSALMPEMLSTLRLTVDGQPVPLTISKDGHLLTAVVPAAPKHRGLRVLRFSVSHAMSPRELGRSADDRTLAVAFDTLSWKCRAAAGAGQR